MHLGKQKRHVALITGGTRLERTLEEHLEMAENMNSSSK